MPILNIGWNSPEKGVIMIDVISSVPSTQEVSPINRIIDENLDNRNPNKSDQQFKKTSKTVVENGKLILEQYDRHGRLIRKTPPGYLPPGQKC